MYGRNAQQRVRREESGEPRLAVCFVEVVALFEEARARFLEKLRRVPVGIDERNEPRSSRCRAEIGADRAGYPGVLHLDRDAAPVGERRAVYLSDRSGRDGDRVEAFEQLAGTFSELALDLLANRRRRSWAARASAAPTARRRARRVARCRRSSEAAPLSSRCPSARRARPRGALSTLRRGRPRVVGLRRASVARPGARRRACGPGVPGWRWAGCSTSRAVARRAPS